MIFVQGIFIWVGFAFLGAVVAALVAAAVSRGAMLQGLMSDRRGGPVGMHRAAFAFGNIGLALVFLVKILEFDGDPRSLDFLTDLFGGGGMADFDLPAVTGALSGMYLWGKTKN